MSVDSSAVSSRSDALALQGRMLSVTRVRVLNADPEAIAAQLSAWASRMPQAVRGMAVVIDSDVEADLPGLLRQLRATGMQPLGVSEGPLVQAARAAGLAVLPLDSRRPAKPQPAARGSSARPESPPASASASVPGPAPAPAPAPAPEGTAKVATRRPTRILVDPVRSGQQVHAQGADLVVLSSVGAGAELIADGCIHVYGRLSGRAIAGASGDETARIFCSRLEADLVAVAGIYAVAEQINEGPHGAAAQIWLDGDQLRIERLA